MGDSWLRKERKGGRCWMGMGRKMHHILVRALVSETCCHLKKRWKTYHYLGRGWVSACFLSFACLHSYRLGFNFMTGLFFQLVCVWVILTSKFKGGLKPFWEKEGPDFTFLQAFPCTVLFSTYVVCPFLVLDTMLGAGSRQIRPFVELSIKH